MLTKDFYRDLKELEELVTPLVGYLNSSNDVSNQEEERAKIAELFEFN